MSSLRLLLAFAEAARQGSFAAAAREMGLTPSAVAKSVARLEQDLNLRLFQRSTRRITLTPEGETLYTRCRRVLQEFEEIETFASDIGQSLSGVLRLDAPVTYGKLVLLPLLAELARAHPLLRLDVRMSDRYSDIVGEGLDAAVRIGNLQDSSLVARRFDWQRLGVYGAPAYFARFGKPSAPDELGSHACAVYRLPATGRERPWQFKEDGKPLDLQPATRLHVNDGEGLAALAVAGLALVQIPEYMARAAVKDGMLEEVLTGHRPDPLPISLVYASARHVPLRLRLLIDHLFEGVNARAIGGSEGL